MLGYNCLETSSYVSHMLMHLVCQKIQYFYYYFFITTALSAIIFPSFPFILPLLPSCFYLCGTTIFILLLLLLLLLSLPYLSSFFPCILLYILTFLSCFSVTCQWSKSYRNLVITFSLSQVRVICVSLGTWMHYGKEMHL